MSLIDILNSMQWGGPNAPAYDGEMKKSHSSWQQHEADAQEANQLKLQNQQLQKQMQAISQMNAALDPIIKSGGMSTQEQHALTSLFMNNLPAQFKAAQGNINEQLVARGISGGQMAGSGDVARNFAGLFSAEAGEQQQGLAQIQAQKFSQLMQALQLKGGVAGMFGANTGLFNRGAQGFLGLGNEGARGADQFNSEHGGGQFFGTAIGQGMIGGALTGLAGGFGNNNNGN